MIYLIFVYLFKKKKRKNKRQGFPLKLCTLVSQMPFYCFLFFCFFFSNLNFKLKRLRCKDSLKNAFDAQAFKEKKRQRKEEMCKLYYPYLHSSGVSFRVLLSLSLIILAAPLVCSRLRDSRVREIEKARSRK